MKNSTLLTRFFQSPLNLGIAILLFQVYFFQKRKNVFEKIEIAMLFLTMLCLALLFKIGDLSFGIGLFFCILVSQRILEYLIVYSRNFILGRGRVFTHFPDTDTRGQWLIIMFLLNLSQVVLSFAVFYRFLSVHFPGSFTQSIGVLDSFISA